MADQRICKVCNVIKPRVPDGQFRNGKNKKWRDESGGLWNGRECPPCYNNRLKEHMKSKRSKGVSDGGQI